MELMQFPQLKTIAIIAEGVPEKRARQLLHTAKEKDVLIIGPATVGKNILVNAYYLDNNYTYLNLKVELNLDASKLETRVV